VIDPSIATFIAILTFAGGIAFGYVEGWDRGSQRGYSVGQRIANADIRRILARTRETD
jgi:hypothetical protein